MGAAQWFGLVHRGIQRESLLLSRMSHSQQRERRTTAATHALFVLGVLFSMARLPSNTETGPIAFTLGVGLLLMPKSMRETFVLGCLIAVTPLLRTFRCAIAFTNHRDLFHFDKQVSCETQSGFLAFQMFAMVSLAVLIDSSTPQIAFAAFYMVLPSNTFGACRNDVLEASACLVYTGLLVALQHWSRASAQLHTKGQIRQYRERRMAAEEVSNVRTGWACIWVCERSE